MASTRLKRELYFKDGNVIGMITYDRGDLKSRFDQIRILEKQYYDSKSEFKNRLRK